MFYHQIIQLIVKINMSIDRKLIRNGNGWALSINSTILKLLDINPENDLINYTIYNDKLIITKSDKKIEKR